MFFCVLHKVLYRENSKIDFFGITIMETQTAFRDRITLNSNHVLVIFVVVLNAPLLKSLTSASINHLLETSCLFAWCIMKAK